jgi:hypothetical protein
MYMEMSQGNSLCNYLKQKSHFFLLKNWRTGRQKRSFLGGLVAVGVGRWWIKGVGG